MKFTPFNSSLILAKYNFCISHKQLICKYLCSPSNHNKLFIIFSQYKLFQIQSHLPKPPPLPPLKPPPLKPPLRAGGLISSGGIASFTDTRFPLTSSPSISSIARRQLFSSPKITNPKPRDLRLYASY